VFGNAVPEELTMKISAMIAAMLAGLLGAASAQSNISLGDVQGVLKTARTNINDMKAPSGQMVASAVGAAQATGVAWIAAVKKAYEDMSGNNAVDSLPPVPSAQLPTNARKQLAKDNKTWGPNYPSKAYKMVVSGETAFVIQNDNDGGSFVNIFDAQGTLIASGSQGESFNFSWTK
jgi:hypothetical protein